MQLKEIFPLFLFTALFHTGITHNTFLGGSNKKEQPDKVQGPCESDNYYDSIVNLKTDNILLYKELSTAWQQRINNLEEGKLYIWSEVYGKCFWWL
jgi:hypothetical protein